MLCVIVRPQKEDKPCVLLHEVVTGSNLEAHSQDEQKIAHMLEPKRQ